MVKRLFIKVGEVPGSGNSNAIQTYSFIDDLSGVTEDLVYYQLKQIDFDGDYETSKIKYVSLFSQIKKITIYPNPATTNFQVLSSFQSEDFSI